MKEWCTNSLVERGENLVVEKDHREEQSEPLFTLARCDRLVIDCRRREMQKHMKQMNRTSNNSGSIVHIGGNGETSIH